MGKRRRGEEEKGKEENPAAPSSPLPNSLLPPVAPLPDSFVVQLLDWMHEQEAAVTPG